MIDVACVGETLWDLRAPEDLESLDVLRAFPGGAAANVALALRSLGVSAELWAAIGVDPIGRALALRIQEAGVRVRSAGIDAPRTGIVFAGKGGVVSYRAPREEARALADALPRRLRVRWVHFAGLLPDRDGAELARVVGRGAASLPLSVDLNTRPRLWRGRSPAAIWPSVAAARLLKCSKDDLRVLRLGEQQLRRRMRRDAVLVITDGPRPTRLVGPFGALRVSPDARPAIQVMGAGDRLCSSLISSLLSAGAELPADRTFWQTALRKAHAFAARAPKR